MSTFLQDLRLGARLLVKKRSFSVVAILTLALGVGANTAIFSVVNGILLRPLPYREPGRLVQFWESNPLKGWTQATVAPANLFDWQARNQSFEDIAAYSGSQTKDAGLSNFFLTGSGEPERIEGLFVTGNIFSVLGVDAAIGRSLTDEETLQGKHRVVVLSHGLWQRRFGGDPSIVGQAIPINGVNRTVVGVMPENFYFPVKEVELWTPMGWDPKQIATLRRPHFLRAVGRLKQGVSMEQARADLASIASQLESEYPDTNTQMGAGIGPLHEWLVGDSRPALLVFLAAVGLVLLISCANVANLLLARAEGRKKEVAIRAALGASRIRIIRQLFTESLVLALTAGSLGILAAIWAKDLLLRMAPARIPRLNEIRLDGSVLGFTLGITIVAALIAGLIPAIQVARRDLTDALKEGQKGAGGSGRARLRSLLVVTEIALSFALVIGAGLLIRSFNRLTAVNAGADINNVLTFKLQLPGAKYPDGTQAVAFFDDLERRLATIPGIESAGAAAKLPLQSYNWTGDATVDGRAADDFLREIRHVEVTPSYFRTMRIPLLMGREYDDRDNANSPPVIVVNDAFARWAYPDQDPIGRRVMFSKPTNPSPWCTIIGVVRGEKQDGLDKEVRAQVYNLHRQNPQNQMVVAVRTTGEPLAMIGAVREEIRALDRDLPPFEIKPMTEVLSNSFATQRFTTVLLGTFAALALGLAAIGIYGVISYTVTQRTHEIGVRRALGATTQDILKSVALDAAKLAAAGIAVGLAASFALTRFIAGLLFNVSVTDPATYIIVALILGAVALVAACIPARRAIKVDPMVALRYE